MNKIANFGMTALLTAVILGMSFNSASGTESQWTGWAQGKTEPYQQQVNVSSDQKYEQYVNQDNYVGWGGGHLGYFTANGGHTIESDLSFHGAANWVCSGGPSLFVEYAGNVVITEDLEFPYVFTAVVTVNGGSGHLANATGTATMSGKFSATLRDIYFDFDGMFDTQGNFQEFGIIELENLGCAKGQIVPYTMQGWTVSMQTVNHSGSIMPTSQPVIDETIPGKTIWTFSAEQGPNSQYYGMPIHVMETNDGMIFCRWVAQCRVEIDHKNWGAARLWFDGCFTVVEGTGRFQNATGSWQMLFTTQPSFGEDLTWCGYQMNGMLQVDPINHNAPALFHYEKQK